MIGCFVCSGHFILLHYVSVFQKIYNRINGKNYNIVDSRADNTYNIWGEKAFANSLIFPEGYSEWLKNAIESSEPDNALTFRIDRRDFIDKLTEILEYVIDFSDQVTGGNFDEIVQEYRGDLFDSDLQEIIDNVTNSMRNNEKK